MTLIKVNRPEKGGITRNRLFPSIFDEYVNDLFKNEYASFVPAVNVVETEKSFIVDVSAPGFNKENFKVEIENGVLTVSGEHTAETSEEKKNFTRKEFVYGSFKRSFNLPENVNEEDITANYENGILKLIIAKKVETPKKAKEIRVS